VDAKGQLGLAGQISIGVITKCHYFIFFISKKKTKTRL